VSRSCSACKERVDEFATTCNVCTDVEVVTKYKLKGSIADTAGTVECVILAEGTDSHKPKKNQVLYCWHVLHSVQPVPPHEACIHLTRRHGLKVHNPTCQHRC